MAAGTRTGGGGRGRRRAAAVFVVTIIAAAALLLGAVWAPVTAVADDPEASPSGSPAGAAGKVVIQIGWNQNLDSLNPFIGYQNVSYAVYGQNYDYLLRYGPESIDPVPGLAESWELSDDGLTWTFHLRKDAVWQDGEPLTARDVAFTYNYVIDNKLGAFSNYAKSIDHVTAADDYTVRVECVQPKADMLQATVPIFPEHIWSKVKPSEAERKFQNSPPCIGSGPWQVVEWKKNQYVRMVANKRYWGGAPKADELIFRFYTNWDTMAMDLKSGEIAYAQVPPAQFTAFSALPGFGVNEAAASNAWENLGFNCYTGPSKGDPACADPAFRRALNWAVDRDKIAEVAFFGHAVPATSILMGGFWKDPDYHWVPTDAQRYSFDLERAAQELDAAGYRDADGDGVREGKDGKPLKLRLWAVSEKPEYTGAAKLIASWFEEVGVGVKMETLDDGAVSQGIYNYVDDVFTPDYDMFIWGWSGDTDPTFPLSVFLTEQIEDWSDCAWSNREYDGLFERQAVAIDPVERQKIAWRMQEILYEESPYIVLVYPRTLEAYDTAHWRGWVKDPGANGSVHNGWSFLALEPVGTAAAEGGGAGWRWPAVGVAAVAVVALVWLLLRRRGGHADEEV